MKQLNTDRIVAVSAMVVSVATLLVFVYQSSLMRQSARASVLPYLNIIVLSNEQGTAFGLGNVGIGPALIDDVRVVYQGRERQIDPYDFFLEVQPGAEKGGLGVDRVQRGRLIPAGYTIRMIEGGAGDRQHASAILKALLHFFEIADVPKSWYASDSELGPGKAIVKVDYSSVYGEHWEIRSDRTVPEPR